VESSVDLTLLKSGVDVMSFSNMFANKVQKLAYLHIAAIYEEKNNRNINFQEKSLFITEKWPKSP
jgi:hypothetical protein